jgi:thymidylate synthase (FAD)
MNNDTSLKNNIKVCFLVNIRKQRMTSHQVITSPQVKLIHYSRPPEGEETGYDLLGTVAYCARVSNPSNQQNTVTNEKLVKYLIDHQHWSPLEMVSICLEIQTTRDISRQILRHRSFSFQEFSQRYAVQEEGMVVREARLQDQKNRQSSLETDDADLIEAWREKQEHVAAVARDVYQWALENGVAKEQARVILPEGMTQTRLYMNGTLRSWVHYIQLRTEKGTQKEHREVALVCAEAIAPVFPLIREFVYKEG